MLAVYNEKKLINEKTMPAFEFFKHQSYLVDTNWIEAAHFVAFSQKNIRLIV